MCCTGVTVPTGLRIYCTVRAAARTKAAESIRHIAVRFGMGIPVTVKHLNRYRAAE